MIASEIMTTNPECCVPTDSVMAAAQLMKSEDVGPIPIVQDKEEKKLAGIVTDRDLAIKVVAEGRDPKTTPVEDVMSEGLVTCRDNDDVRSVLKLMEENQLRRIPVVDKNDRLQGIIAQADVATRLGNAQAAGEVVQHVSQ
ncbi:MAG TPA: CBS domain-containing protein [Pyrinomonadaceae bacterium]|nr:CBS domain-containing protein [Pyrinomonadaceae bacterium]